MGNYVCLEASVWQNVQFACKFTCVWRLCGRLVAQKYDKLRVSVRLGGANIRQFTCVWKARCGKSARSRNLTANLRVSGRLVAQKIRQSTSVWKARCGKSAYIRNLTASVRVSGRLVA
jgi:hypothetical protein